MMIALDEVSHVFPSIMLYPALLSNLYFCHQQKFCSNSALDSPIMTRERYRKIH